MTEGRCLCGALRYQIDGPFIDVVHCHCSMCRKHHGTPFATWAAAPLSGFRWLGDTSTLRTYQSSAKAHRDFCSVCGSVAPMLEDAAGMVIAPAGNLEGDLGMRPTKHMFVGSKAAWYAIADGLPQFEEYPPEFGMSATPREPVAVPAGTTAGSCLCGDVAYETAAAHVLLSLLALPPGPQCRALRQRVLPGGGLPLDPRRGPGAGIRPAGCTILRHGVLQALRIGGAAGERRAQHGQRAGGIARQ
jgi:hypothetical protein